MNALDQIIARLDRLEYLSASCVTWAILGATLIIIITFNSQQCLPMQLYNATLSFDAELQYPPGVPEIPNTAKTKRQLMSLSVAEAQVVAEVLHLPALPGHPLVVDRRNQILDFLGCALRA